MKKILLIFLISFCSFLSVNAQWIPTTNLESTSNNVVISNNVAGTEVKLSIGNTNLSGYSVIRFGDSSGDQAALHRFNSGWVTPASSVMWETNSIGFYEGVGSMNIGGKNSFKVFTGNSNSERLRVDANGNVGIGTVAPGTKLDVNGIIRTYNIDNSTANWDNLSMWSNGAKSFIQSNGDESGLFIKSNGGNKVIFESNVGVGTSIPNSKLHVSSGYIDEANIDYQSANMIIEATSTTRTIGQGAALGFVVPANTDGSNAWQQGRILVTPDNTLSGNANGRMYIQARGWSTAINNWDWQNNLVLLSNGNVGVGSVNPDAKLTVNGTIHATEVKVDIAVPADFVFDPSYNLKPLSEVEAYVKAEKHLPEIPSAAEIKANGSNIGEMQNKLLQKIEELTLYVIEQQKQIEELKKQAAQDKLAKQ